MKAVDDAVQTFQNLIDNSEFTLQLFDMLPIPVEVFAADGTALFINRASMELNGIADSSLIIGKYNLLDDPVCNETLGHREAIKKAFGGEAVSVPDFRPPIQDLVNRGVIKEKPYEAALMEAHLCPIKDKNNLVCVLCVFIVRNIYRGKPEVLRAKENISLAWRGKFDAEATAESLAMSVTQLYRLFKEHLGMTPGSYHKLCKIEHLKEKLIDKNLTVKEAFKACGEDSRGWVAKVFKELTGLSPAEFRKQNYTGP